MDFTKVPGYSAVPHAVRAFYRSGEAERWHREAIEWMYFRCRGESLTFTAGQMQAHLRAEGVRTLRGTVPSRWSIGRLLDKLQAGGLAVRDKVQNTKDGLVTVTLARWVHGAQTLVVEGCYRVMQQVKEAVARKAAERKAKGSQAGGMPAMQQGVATPSKGDPLSEEKRAVESDDARQRRLRRLGYTSTPYLPGV